MAKREKKDSVVEKAVLAKLGDYEGKQPASKRVLTRFTCGHVGAEIGVKAKGFIRWAMIGSRIVEDNTEKKCPDCK